MSERQSLGLPLPVLRDMHGQIIREFDILRVFHFYGRRCGKGRQRHYMYKIAVVKQWTNPRIGRQWWFHHTAEMGEGLTNGYCPYKGSGEQWAVDQTLEGVEVIDSPATLRDENEKRRIKPADHSGTRKRRHLGREAESEGGEA
jgi:hypothetical protein